MSKLRVILLTHGGAEEVLSRLCALPGAEVVGLFVETESAGPPRRGLREKLARSVRYDGYAGTAAKFARKFLRRGDSAGETFAHVRDGHARLRELAEKLGVPAHFVANFHAEQSLELMRAARADLGVVYGTNILKESVFKIPRLGSINLHQGLAPLYRGGPPVFWELYNGEPEVGLTVHFVETKVDTGDIVLQERVPLEYDFARYRLDFESFIADFRASIHARCAQIVADAVQLIAEGAAERRAQDTTQGRRYRLPVKGEKDELRRRLRERARESGRSHAHAAREAEGR
jgi:folate-dependent phosphoribosylglycinamide formyltransferase PurN